MSESCAVSEMSFHNTRKRRVRLVETGEIFESAHQCAEELGVAPSSVIRCAHNNRGQCKGYHIEYIDE